MKVLIVDDASTVREAVREILESKGFEVHEAEDGYSALELIKTEVDFDVILLDWEMPKMNGYTFLNVVRQNELAVNTKIIMLTSSNTKEKIFKAIHAGADEYIIKPFESEIVIEKIQKTMAG